EPEPEPEPTPEPSSSISVYNQAYIENYAEDTISEIKKNAHDAYVLIDSFSPGVSNHIAAIQNNNNQVSGYISVGTGEDWRDDFKLLSTYLSPIEWKEWPGEFFVNQTTTGILDVMKARIDTMADLGLDWVEFDNMDWFDGNKSKYKLKITTQQSKAYVNALCAYTHKKGMKCMAKNMVEGFENFDGVTYESYNNEKNWWDNEGMMSFLSSGKPVIIVHYNESNCDEVYDDYKDTYNSEDISFICEDKKLKKYNHY
ncbi:MAG: endo alpha-1,4 polygalactosaminidase, partial [Methylococcales bacterium]|nr:endo alpha-1,4 polygalactosaminidase [Methylococcales bacterium]